MQSQMEAKLASMSLKSPGLKSNMPASPTARNFSGAMNNFLSPDSASLAAGGNDPAATLAQQRAKLNANKASNAAHRISAPALGSTIGDRNVWGNQLGQVDERASSPAGSQGQGQELTVPSSASASRPKSTDFSGVANAFTGKSPRPGLDDALSPMVGDSWASMVNTPLMPMFAKERNPGQSLDAAASKLTDWAHNGAGPGVPLISDPPKKLNRLSKGGDDGNIVAQGAQQPPYGCRCRLKRRGVAPPSSRAQVSVPSLYLHHMYIQVVYEIYLRLTRSQRAVNGVAHAGVFSRDARASLALLPPPRPQFVLPPLSSVCSSAFVFAIPLVATRTTRALPSANTKAFASKRRRLVQGRCGRREREEMEISGATKKNGTYRQYMRVAVR